jgi:heptosyltransferase-2
VRREGIVHQSDYYRALVRGLGIDCDDQTTPRIAARQPSAARAQAILAQHGVGASTRLVGFAPGAAYGQAKQWPPDRMAELMAGLITDHAVACVIVGASHDRDAGRAIESWLRAHAPETLARVVNLTGHTSLGALVGLVERMTAFVSNDSGAMHLAAALHRPVVGIFGPTDERTTGPIGPHTVLTSPVFCRPCQLRECPIDHRCMKRITVDMVRHAVEARLQPAEVA